MPNVWLDERLCHHGDLPDICLKCGQPTSNRVKKTFNWNPPWIWVTILAGLLPYVIVAAVTRKTITARLPMCDQHKGHWWKRILLVVAGLLGVIALIVLVVVVLDEMGPGNKGIAGPILGLMIPIAFLAWVVMAIVAQVTAIRAAEIDDYRGLKLAGVCREFIDAYREDYEPSPGRMDRRGLERWEDREPRRPRPARDDDRRYRGEDEEDDRRRSSRDRYRDDY
jgi:hypothetical protein